MVLFMMCGGGAGLGRDLQWLKPLATPQEVVPDHDKPDNIVRPLTFSLAFSGEAPRVDVFELRVSGWRKYIVVALSDMLAVTDALAGAEEPLPLGADPAGPRYFVSVSPFFGVSAEVAAQMAHWHIAHYLRLGWSGYTLYLNREYLPAFREHVALAAWIAEKRLALVLWDSVGMTRISIGDDWGSPVNRMGNSSRLDERVYALQSTVYAHSLLAFWTGTRDNYVGLFDIDEYFAVRDNSMVCGLSVICLFASACCGYALSLDARASDTFAMLALNSKSQSLRLAKIAKDSESPIRCRLTTLGTPSNELGTTALRARQRCMWSGMAPRARTMTKRARAALCRIKLGGLTSPMAWCILSSASHGPANTPTSAFGRQASSFHQRKMKHPPSYAFVFIV